MSIVHHRRRVVSTCGCWQWKKLKKRTPPKSEIKFYNPIIHSDSSSDSAEFEEESFSEMTSLTSDTFSAAGSESGAAKRQPQAFKKKDVGSKRGGLRSGYEAKRQHIPKQSGELVTEEGDILSPIQENLGWLKAKNLRTKRIGWIAKVYVQKMVSKKFEMIKIQIVSKQNENEETNEMDCQSHRTSKSNLHSRDEDVASAEIVKEDPVDQASKLSICNSQKVDIMSEEPFTQLRRLQLEAKKISQNPSLERTEPIVASTNETEVKESLIADDKLSLHQSQMESEKNSAISRSLLDVSETCVKHEGCNEIVSHSPASPTISIHSLPEKKTQSHKDESGIYQSLMFESRATPSEKSPRGDRIEEFLNDTMEAQNGKWEESSDKSTCREKATRPSRPPSISKCATAAQYADRQKHRRRSKLDGGSNKVLSSGNCQRCVCDSERNLPTRRSSSKPRKQHHHRDIESNRKMREEQSSQLSSKKHHSKLPDRREFNQQTQRMNRDRSTKPVTSSSHRSSSRPKQPPPRPPPSWKLYERARSLERQYRSMASKMNELCLRENREIDNRKYDENKHKQTTQEQQASYNKKSKTFSPLKYVKPPLSPPDLKSLMRKETAQMQKYACDKTEGEFNNYSKLKKHKSPSKEPVDEELFYPKQATKTSTWNDITQLSRISEDDSESNHYSRIKNQHSDSDTHKYSSASGFHDKIKSNDASENINCSDNKLKEKSQSSWKQENLEAFIKNTDFFPEVPSETRETPNTADDSSRISYPVKRGVYDNKKQPPIPSKSSHASELTEYSKLTLPPKKAKSEVQNQSVLPPPVPPILRSGKCPANKIFVVRQEFIPFNPGQIRLRRGDYLKRLGTDPLRRGWSYGMLSCGKAGYFPDSCVKPAIVKRPA
ncbi:DgyrCDS4584 [Dimorphilus gyrociliatus]|uniref:DgyrCDS4584 n=1 Tax=Dimorphilus gyrociliatus TaxID=2664684 RepID=A0A7I8VH01_9ANNE|nr:DgyrCDS4584 [Dimorphilus gyrociliatus]